MDQEQGAILAVAILAALADGHLDELERRSILSLAAGNREDYDTALQAAQAGTLRIADVARFIVSGPGKRLAFETATAVCNADGICNDAERAFLDALRGELQLGADAGQFERDAAAVSGLPLSTGAGGGASASAGAPDEAALDRMILDAAILNGALELLPETLASMAILPLQMRLVYRIGTSYRYELGREHIRDFIATLGVGLTAQYIEGFARKLLGGLFGGLGRQTASSGMAFVSTYAIGQAARRYYAGGRKLEAVQLREIYQSLLTDARGAASRAQSEVQARVASLRSGGLADVLQGR
jgi:uncharacterized protein (DUF697 family)